MSLRDNLLSNPEILISNIESNLDEIISSKEITESLIRRIEDEKATSEMLREYKSNLLKLESVIPETRDLLERLKKNGKEKKQQDIYRKLELTFKKEENEYYRSVDRMNRLARSKNFDKKLDEVSINPKESILSQAESQDFNNGDIPVLEVYDQEEEVMKRGAQVKEIRKEAQIINDVAGEINNQIYEQEGKIDQFTRKMGDNRDNVRQANLDLEKAEQMGKQSKGKIVKLILIILVLLILLILVLMATNGFFQ